MGIQALVWRVVLIGIPEIGIFGATVAPVIWSSVMGSKENKSFQFIVGWVGLKEAEANGCYRWLP